MRVFFKYSLALPQLTGQINANNDDELSSRPADNQQIDFHKICLALHNLLPRYSRSHIATRLGGDAPLPIPYSQVLDTQSNLSISVSLYKNFDVWLSSHFQIAHPQENRCLHLNNPLWR